MHRYFPTLSAMRSRFAGHAMPLLVLLAVPLCGTAVDAQTVVQTGTGSNISHFSGAPAGSCASSQVAENDATGDFYDCLVGAWFKIGPGAGSSGPWSGLGNPTSNLTLSMGANTSTFTSNSGASVGTQWSFADTWNAAGFTGPWWKVNITDTASQANALLFDWQVGGASKFNVDKKGNATFAGTLSFGGSNLQINKNGTQQGFISVGGGTSLAPYLLWQDNSSGHSSYLTGDPTVAGRLCLGTFVPGADCTTASPGGTVWQNGAALLKANSATGTTLNKLAKLDAADTATVAGTGDTTIPLFIVTAGAGTSGNAILQLDGEAPCVFDNTAAVRDFVIASATTGGDCHDTGSTTAPTSGWVFGQAASAGTGTQTVQLAEGFNAAAGGGGATGSHVINSQANLTAINVSTSEQTLFTYTMPANTLSTARMLRIYSHITSASLAVNGTVKIYFGASSFSSSDSSNNGQYTDATVRVKTNTAEFMRATYEDEGASNNTRGYADATEDITGSIVIKLTFTGGSAVGTVTPDSWMVEVVQ
jgi:hypothetical protein